MQVYASNLNKTSLAPLVIVETSNKVYAYKPKRDFQGFLRQAKKLESSDRNWDFVRDPQNADLVFIADINQSLDEFEKMWPKSNPPLEVIGDYEVAQETED